ncbi:MAG TPA: hypothetical protein VGQ00_01715 [Candidatus Norongarragalinales archaeon]|jgi:hypothetical protein|nr:hypothetical protein [Candidatus Norongarragalinales archaeon]
MLENGGSRTTAILFIALLAPLALAYGFPPLGEQELPGNYQLGPSVTPAPTTQLAFITVYETSPNEISNTPTPSPNATITPTPSPNATTTPTPNATVTPTPSPVPIAIPTFPNCDENDDCILQDAADVPSGEYFVKSLFVKQNGHVVVQRDDRNGGQVTIHAKTFITVKGTIDASGAAGARGTDGQPGQDMGSRTPQHNGQSWQGGHGGNGFPGSDGGSAGAIVLDAPSIRIDGSLIAKGGAGGAGGNGGNGGAGSDELPWYYGCLGEPGWGGDAGNGALGGNGGNGGLVRLNSTNTTISKKSTIDYRTGLAGSGGMAGQGGPRGRNYCQPTGAQNGQPGYNGASGNLGEQGIVLYYFQPFLSTSTLVNDNLDNKPRTTTHDGITIPPAPSLQNAFRTYSARTITDSFANVSYNSTEEINATASSLYDYDWSAFTAKSSLWMYKLDFGKGIPQCPFTTRGLPPNIASDSDCVLGNTTDHNVTLHFLFNDYILDDVRFNNENRPTRVTLAKQTGRAILLANQTINATENYSLHFEGAEDIDGTRLAKVSLIDREGSIVASAKLRQGETWNTNGLNIRLYQIFPWMLPNPDADPQPVLPQRVDVAIRTSLLNLDDGASIAGDSRWKIALQGKNKRIESISLIETSSRFAKQITGVSDWLTLDRENGFVFSYAGVTPRKSSRISIGTPALDTLNVSNETIVVPITISENSSLTWKITESATGNNTLYAVVSTTDDFPYKWLWLNNGQIFASNSQVATIGNDNEPPASVYFNNEDSQLELQEIIDDNSTTKTWSIAIDTNNDQIGSVLYANEAIANNVATDRGTILENSDALGATLIYPDNVRHAFYDLG